MRKLELTEAEFQALCGLLDAGVRAVGLRGVKDAAAILAKLEASVPVEASASAEAEAV